MVSFNLLLYTIAIVSTFGQTVVENSSHENETLTGDAVKADTFYCHTCVSSSFKDCVWNPYTSLTKVCEEGDRACATVILPDGHTFRGCSQDEECAAAGEACILCDTFSGCNIDRFPVDRLKCNICQSSLSNSCKALPYPRQFEKLCVRYVAGDACVTVFDGFHVAYRDCLSGVSEEDQSKCDASEPSVECVTCARLNCNTAKVRQDDRCLQCTSNMTHCSSGLRTATVCSTPSDGKCFSRVEENGYLVRGCLADILDPEFVTNCTSNGRECNVCDGPGCNAAFLPTNTLSCAQCDSKQELACAQEQQDDVAGKYCRRHVQNDRCYVRTDTDGSLQRGCLSDLTDETLCDTSDAGSCNVCDASNCNSFVYPSNRLSCYQCNGWHSATCNVDQRSLETGEPFRCRLHRSQDGCYTKLYSDKVDLTLAALSSNIVGCYSCVSSQSKDCVWNPTGESLKICQATNYTCATVLLPDGHTYRGCALDAECIAAGDQCVRCAGDSICNNQTVPANRLSCNVCSTNLTSSCQTAGSGQFEKRCVRHLPDDRCVTVFDGFNVTYRDCLSAVPREDHQKFHVVTCAGANCNTGRVRDDDRCLQCTSNMTQCADGTWIATPCAKPSGSKCYARLDEGGYLLRGCASDLSDPLLLARCGREDRKCVVCEGAGCNAQIFTTSSRSCLRCDSRFNPDCLRPVRFGSVMENCPRYVMDDRCYVRSNTDGSVSRGCVSDLTPGTSSCEAGSCIMRGCLSDLAHEVNPCAGLKPNECYVCYTAGCNFQGDIVHKSAGSTTNLHPWLMILCTLLFAHVL
uniref:DUF753 domain-containing protein n=1 Tax=Anopheles farauti TaxID=69004 RepID=A0A182QYB6_9DIPT